MVQARQTTPSEVPLPNQSRLVDAETEAYVKAQKKADFARNISQYMFWGATTLLAGVLAVAIGVANPPAGIAFGAYSAKTIALAAGGAASVSTFLGSLMFSRRATALSERANVLYSDIDSQHQAKRMVQAFAKAQSTSAGVAISESGVPFTRRDGRSWAAAVGGPSGGATNWADRVTAQSAIEDAQTLHTLQSRR